MQEIQERPQAGDGGQRGRGAERQQAFQSANQLISQASKPLNFQASGVRGGGGAPVRPSRATEDSGDVGRSASKRSNQRIS